METELKKAQEEKERPRLRDQVTPRHFDFKDKDQPPTCHRESGKSRKVMDTPKDNLDKALEILAKRDDKDAIDHVKQLLGTATSRKLASDPKACMSSARNEPAK